ncbi:hypothetical protein OG304_04640 [Streptomyces sp. NBC_00160]|uniref:hypothetical protein n=1 Tax=Streptomyces sp. NBC_00160 TaxID=2903628 RepID=UPI00224EC358|nr:hypothetical protein [Streptomyces sp. NBC_00160]MCX5302740.1 hypothetical protein [Streptomyces sp. NBC_00160]
MTAGVSAVLCVLLPLAGHALAQGRTPQWLIIALLVVITVPAALVLTRRKLTDTQLLVAFAAAQLAYHLAYSLPAACVAVAEGSGASCLPQLVEHDAASGPPHGVLLGGHLITLLLAARLLGLSRQLLWCSTPLVEAMHRVLRFVWPPLSGTAGTGPEASFAESSHPLTSALLVRLQAGRAPPKRACSPFGLSRLTPVTGSCLA